MSDFIRPVKLPPEQQAIRAKCFHPTGTFAEFKKEEVEQSIPECFEKTVTQYFNRVAIETNDVILTYADLNQAVNRVAHSLLEHVGDRREPVILISDHGPFSIIACIGVFKAGKILIAIDPTFPLNRAEHIRQDAGAIAILTDDRNVPFAARLATDACPLLNVDALGNAPAQANPTIRLFPSDPAEIRYTSGSTGQPKGIVRSHRKLLHGSMLSINSAHICPQDRLLALRRLSFGSNDMLKGLFAGATVCPFDITKPGLSNMADFMKRRTVTYFTSSSSIFRGLIGELDKKDTLSSVRLLQLGDEPLNKGDVEAYKRLFSDDCILMHRLSCGEAGNICQYFIDKHTEIATLIVPVGYPVEDKQLLLLDENGQEIMPGDTGEIAVRSRYLSSEYWKKPEMTGMKFLPADGTEERRTYLTGDLGRMLSDGSLLYLGRKDLEIKIRGCKVALPEIEAVLRELSTVHDAAVKAWDNDSGEPRLAAYIVLRDETKLSSGELRDFLKTKLPDYMIPSRFVFIARLPSINGKLDRGALPPVQNTRPNLSTPFIAPKTLIESKLTQIWADLLSLDRVGIDDNFFDLGGHSLTATQLVSRIISQFRLDLPLQALFQSPTVAEMAAVIAKYQETLNDQELNRLLVELEFLSDEDAQRLLDVSDERLE